MSECSTIYSRESFELRWAAWPREKIGSAGKTLKQRGEVRTQHCIRIETSPKRNHGGRIELSSGWRRRRPRFEDVVGPMGRARA